MAIVQFPPVEEADKYGLLAVGGDLEIESLLLAYRSGIFPWPLFPRQELAWFAPPVRAILYTDKFHVSQSLAKEIKRERYAFTIDADFAGVIERCSDVKNRRGQRGTWISPEIQRAYLDLHEAGYGHSVEVWEGETLVGGLYGVGIARYFAGESMFHSRPNTSKLALYHLVSTLKELNIRWIDCQAMTPHLKSLGAEEVPREKFMDMLAEALEGYPGMGNTLANRK
jgi:leucyl/phenylalanyl-tRNA---protein transferase